MSCYRSPPLVKCLVLGLRFLLSFLLGSWLSIWLFLTFFLCFLIFSFPFSFTFASPFSSPQGLSLGIFRFDSPLYVSFKLSLWLPIWLSLTIGLILSVWLLLFELFLELCLCMCLSQFFRLFLWFPRGFSLAFHKLFFWLSFWTFLFRFSFPSWLSHFDFSILELSIKGLSLGIPLLLLTSFYDVSSPLWTFFVFFVSSDFRTSPPPFDTPDSPSNADPPCICHWTFLSLSASFWTPSQLCPSRLSSFPILFPSVSSKSLHYLIFPLQISEKRKDQSWIRKKTLYLIVSTFKKMYQSSENMSLKFTKLIIDNKLSNVLESLNASIFTQSSEYYYLFLILVSISLILHFRRKYGIVVNVNKTKINRM